MFIVQKPSVLVPVKMEGPAHFPTLAPVMRGGLECSVKQVHTYIRTSPGHSYGVECMVSIDPIAVVTVSVQCFWFLMDISAVHLCRRLSLYIHDLNVTNVVKYFLKRVYCSSWQTIR